MDTSTTITYNKPIRTHSLTSALSIEAGAGCGKTYAMIERIIHMLSSGQTTLKRLLIITFTNNAADELLERVHSRLLDFQDEPWSKKALEDIGYSNIQTIHSFAHTLCQSFHQQLQLPKNFVLLDERNSYERINEAISSLYWLWHHDKTKDDFVSLLQLYNVSLDQLTTLFHRMLSAIYYLPGDEKLEEDFEFSLPYSRIKEIVANSSEVIRKTQNINFDSLKPLHIDRITSFRKFANALNDTKDELGIIRIIINQKYYIKSKSFNRKVAASSPIDYKEAEEAICQLGQSCDDLLLELNDNLLTYLSNLLRSKIYTYRNRSFHSGIVAFDDIIIGAHHLVNNDEIREEIWCRYDSIFVDEFQDTDKLQLEVIKAITSEGSQDDLARICIAGDPLQSIYSFRGADVNEYIDFVSSQSFVHHVLTESRRSVPEITDSTNEISSLLFDDYKSLTALRPRIADNTETVTIVYDELDLLTSEVYLEQSETIVEKFSSLYNNLIIFDKKLNINRPCTYSDMTILIRDRSCMPMLKESLEKYNIPYQSDTVISVWDHIFIRTICALVGAISDPSNEMCVVSSLISPIFQIDRDILARYSYTMQHEQGRYASLWDYATIDESIEIESEIQHAFNKLEDLNIRSQFLSPTEVLNLVLIDLELNNIFSSVFEKETIEALTRFIMNHALSYENSHVLATPIDYSQFLHESLSQNDDQIQANNNEDGDSINIMTIHGAKGLEFPIVGFLPSQNPIGDRGVGIYNKRDDNTFLISFSSKLQHSKYSDYQREKDELIYEEKRLIHVAITRARDYLVIASQYPKRSRGQSQARLFASLATLDNEGS